jgi:hypothetical protein
MEIMDAEDPCSSFTLPVQNQNGTHLARLVWCILPILLRTFLIMKTMIGVLLILAGLPTFSYILPLLNVWCYDVIFEGVLSYPDFSFLLANHLPKLPSFYTAPTAIRALAKEKYRIQR